MTSAYPSVNGINYCDIAIATATTADSIHWFKTYGLLNIQKICPSCGANMMEVAKNNLSDGVIWSCGRPYLAKGIAQECRIANVAVTDWRNFCRDVCAEYYVAQNIKLAGSNRIVEIDEMEDRSADTLLGIIQDRILPGTTIISDLWRSYNTLNQLGYRHLTVNYSINVVDPVTFASTNHIECLWKHVKNRNKRENGTARSLLQTHLIEFMWRYEFKDEIFQKLLE
uniref:ISXO2-like transposase domain-containing protein n=1 Tax=Octopus bimaculoides TaxID=37653 RepID=A0A0L8HN37_OCTBM